jgi:hypothetical protein
MASQPCGWPSSSRRLRREGDLLDDAVQPGPTQRGRSAPERLNARIHFAQALFQGDRNAGHGKILLAGLGLETEAALNRALLVHLERAGCNGVRHPATGFRGPAARVLEIHDGLGEFKAAIVEHGAPFANGRVGRSGRNRACAGLAGIDPPTLDQAIADFLRRRSRRWPRPHPHHPGTRQYGLVYPL